MEDNQFVDYYEIIIKTSTKEEDAEIGLAILQQHDFFESFVEQPGMLLAYVPENLYEEKKIIAAVSQLPGVPSFETRRIPRENWNIFWEQNYSAIEIDNFCFIHPDFIEPSDDFRYNIRIQPKMSFGTGHHATTRLIIRLLQQFSCAGKRVADVGCGTGILGILAAKMGASSVSMIDIDPWCVENARENTRTNHVFQATARLGTAATLVPEKPFDVVFANITRNVLLEEASVYQLLLKSGGTILLSGFYETDVPLLLEKYQTLGFRVVSKLEENNWTALQLSYKQLIIKNL